MRSTKSVFLIYGEQTVTVSFKVPESQKDKIISEIRDNVLSKYENPKRIEIDSREVEVKKPKNISPVTEKETKEIKAISYDLPKSESYNYIKTLPLGTELVKGYGSKGALRKLGSDYFTKRTFKGELEMIQHSSESSAFKYAESNFK